MEVHADQGDHVADHGALGEHQEAGEGEEHPLAHPGEDANELESKRLVSPLISPIVVPYIISYIIPL